MQDAGARVWRLSADERGHVDCAELLPRLESAGVQSVLVEGGAKVLGSFFDAGLVNEVWAFIAPLIIGGSEAPGAVGGTGVAALHSAHRFGKQEMETLDGDVLIRLS
jgi:diaminohydroxyphosphoribosylaminopyrimidine deaminase/5-amino-6-(5-phosphoribosylamino)uracil reductase